MIFFPTYLAKVMVTGTEPIRIAGTYLPICGIFLFAVDFLFVFRNGCQGFGKPLVPMISGIAEMALRIGVIALFINVIGFRATAYAEASAWIGALILNMASFEHTLNKSLGTSAISHKKLRTAA
jgi:Na+-driven multidrug efflux pump